MADFCADTGHIVRGCDFHARFPQSADSIRKMDLGALMDPSNPLALCVGAALALSFLCNLFILPLAILSTRGDSEAPAAQPSVQYVTVGAEPKPRRVPSRKEDYYSDEIEETRRAMRKPSIKPDSQTNGTTTLTMMKRVPSKRSMYTMVSTMEEAALAVNERNAEVKALTAREVLDDLKAGNSRFWQGATGRNDLSMVERRTLINGQAPKAMVIGCADSRVPIEIVFDQGLGAPPHRTATARRLAATLAPTPTRGRCRLFWWPLAASGGAAHCEPGALSCSARRCRRPLPNAPFCPRNPALPVRAPAPPASRPARASTRRRLRLAQRGKPVRREGGGHNRLRGAPPGHQGDRGDGASGLRRGQGCAATQGGHPQGVAQPQGGLHCAAQHCLCARAKTAALG
jgi:hypothetical protein